MPIRREKMEEGEKVGGRGEENPSSKAVDSAVNENSLGSLM